MEILKIIKGSLLIFYVTFLFSCNKDEGVGTVGLAKINVINAVVSGGNVKANVGIKDLPWSSIADNKILGGFNDLGRLYLAPTNGSIYLRVAPISDTTKLWYDQQKQLSEGTMYTLYLSGTPSNVRTSFHEELNFPKYIVRDAGQRLPSVDSIVNIRFVNLSPSGPQVDINIKGESSKEASDLGYETFTNFKAYPATTGIEEILFEIRKSSDGSLVATYSFSVDFYRFRSVTVMMMGIYLGSGLPDTDQYKVESVVYQ